MYETKLFADGIKFIEWVQKNVGKSQPAYGIEGWPGEIRFIRLEDNLILLYQIDNQNAELKVCDLHMILWGTESWPRKDVFKVSKFFRPEGEILWHASVIFGGRAPTTFCVANAVHGELFEKYSGGGNFTMVFSGLGDYLECRNDKGVIRFYDGNYLEAERERKNDPTLDHADLIFSEARTLNSCDVADEPALAEFTGVIEDCQPLSICGVKCYRLSLWSGVPSEPASFPWTLLIAANRIKGKYVPRVGDCVHGTASMFGSFYDEAQKKPTIFLDRELQETHEENGHEANQEIDELETAEQEIKEQEESEDNATYVNTSEEERQDGWEWLPRLPEEYPEVPAHGGGLSESAAEVLRKFVVYSDYRNHIKGELTPLKAPGRKDLKRIIDSIDYVITSRGNLHIFGSLIESIGIRHFVADAKTGERHLWCCIPSGFLGHFRTNLLVALDENGDVLRYTFYMGAWDWRRLLHGMSVQINFQSAGKLRHYKSIGSAVKDVGKMLKADYIIACSLGHTAMVQAYCDKAENGVQEFTIEWRIHYLPWQFIIKNGTREQLLAMLKEFDRHGIEPVETMARWEWCRMKCNV